MPFSMIFKEGITTFTILKAKRSKRDKYIFHWLDYNLWTNQSDLK